MKKVKLLLCFFLLLQVSTMTSAPNESDNRQEKKYLKIIAKWPQKRTTDLITAYISENKNELMINFKEDCAMLKVEIKNSLGHSLIVDSYISDSENYHSISINDLSINEEYMLLIYNKEGESESIFYLN